MAAAALLGSAGAQAQQRARPTDLDLFCHDLRRVANEAPDFVGMYNAHPAPPWFGFRPGVCRASAASDAHPAAYWCYQTLAPRHLTVGNLAEMTAACLPEAKRVPKSGYGDDVALEAPGRRRTISGRGMDRGKVGRSVTYRVEAVSADR